MAWTQLLFLFLFVFVCSVTAKKGFKDWNQRYGFVNVRRGARTFYWLFLGNNVSTIEEAANFPIVIWLQGGPGGGSTGFGNFFEIGPYDENFKARNSTWAKYTNLLFIDNPVGAGFSYVKKYKYLTTNNSQIATDLVAFTKKFYSTYPKFKNTPLYVFSESYGGKMAAEYVYELNKVIQAGDIAANLSGVALGDSWISPVDTCLSWAPYLYNIGEIDENGYKAIDEVAQRAKKAFDEGSYRKATQEWGNLEDEISIQTYDIDFYNILTKISSSSSMVPHKKHVKRLGLINELRESEEDIMNKEVRKALGITSKAVYGSQAGAVFNHLWVDFMKPVTDIVAKLLNETQISVVVYSGQLDLIVDTPGTLVWVNNLSWPDINKWKNATRNPLVADNIIEGFTKKYGKFSFYWINRAGHMSPSDNPNGAVQMLKEVTELV